LSANRHDGTESGALRVNASRTIRHPQYNPSNLNNDNALIQLPSPVSL